MVLCNEIIMFGSENRNSLRVCQMLKWDLAEIVWVFLYFRGCGGAEDGFSTGAGADGVPAGLQKSQVTIRGHESLRLYGWTHGGRQRRSGDSKHRSVRLNSHEPLTNRLSGRPSVSPQSPCKSQRRTCDNIYQGRKASFPITILRLMVFPLQSQHKTLLLLFLCS